MALYEAGPHTQNDAVLLAGEMASHGASQPSLLGSCDGEHGVTMVSDRPMLNLESPNQDSQPHGQVFTRKRRRGVIEKRRRDRINSSLAELRRQVPTAFEKQGSQKLEKAEILQLAVQHLRLLISKNPTHLSLYPNQDAAEYYSMGFRFCASDVDEFLSNEGVELHDPLRMRLSNHLQCFGAQRQNAFASAASSTFCPAGSLGSRPIDMSASTSLSIFPTGYWK